MKTRKRFGYEILQAILELYESKKKRKSVIIQKVKLFIIDDYDSYTVSLVSKPGIEEVVRIYKQLLRVYKEDGIFVDGRPDFSSTLQNLEDVLKFRNKKLYRVNELTRLICKKLDSENVDYKLRQTIFSNYITINNRLIRISDHDNMKRELNSENLEISQYISQGMYDEKEIKALLNRI